MKKVLVANRGEIACRIIRSCRALGLASVAVYSDADAGALHVEMADEAQRIGPSPAKQSYLVADNLLAAAKITRADAVHPGYGFLAENAGFARAVIEAGLAWVGPSPRSIEDMGDKERARRLAQAAGLPVVPGSPRFARGELGDLEAAAEVVGFPLLVKAAAGGGGIGMRRANSAAELRQVVEATQTLAEKSFGDGTVYLERLVPVARHVEVQIFGLGDGRAVHMGERECSIQRRYQKVLEESPSPSLRPHMRAQMCRAAVDLAVAERYRGAGTIEFIVDVQRDAFYFLEMNTRIQVEHPVTEMNAGLDLVGLQICLARGDDLSALTQESITVQGHAIECRIYAENPEKNFLPSPGTLAMLRLPEPSATRRVDSGVRQGDQITFHYDPMIAKLIAHGAGRIEAVERMTAMLREMRVEGVATNIPFLLRLLAHPAFLAGDTVTDFLGLHAEHLLRPAAVA